MSSIGSTPPGFGTTGFDPAGQVSLDEARQHGLLRGDADVGEAAATPAALVDPGESVLNVPAWAGVEAPHTLPPDAAFGARLAVMDRAEAASAAVDGILAGF